MVCSGCAKEIAALRTKDALASASQQVAGAPSLRQIHRTFVKYLAEANNSLLLQIPVVELFVGHPLIEALFALGIRQQHKER